MTKKSRTKVTIITAVVAASLAFASVFGALASTARADGPTVATDKVDYEAGEVVTVSGAGFQGGEVVHLTGAGSTNGSTIDVSATADASGALAVSFRLSDFYEETYALTASGGQSGLTARVSFTDKLGPFTVRNVDCGCSNPVTLAPNAASVFQAFYRNGGGNPTLGTPPGGTTISWTQTGGSLSVSSSTIDPLTGLASVTYTAGTVPNVGGHYDITGSAGSDSQSQNINIVAPAAATSLAVSAASGTYGGTASLSATLTSGATPVTGVAVSFTLNGNAAGSGTTDTSGVATVTGASLAGIDANTYPTGVAASFAGNSSFLASSGTGSLTVNKANATVSVSGYSGTYDGNAHGATGTATGVGGADLSASLSLGSSFTNVPGGTATWTFTGGTNYNDQSSTVAITIAKADATIVTTPYSGTYDAAAHSTSGTATGVKGEDLSASLSFTANSYTNVPGGTASWSFTGGTNYKDATGTAAVTITKANATVSVSGYSGTYDGNAHGATGTATGVGGADLSGSLSLGSSFTNVPGGTAHWAFAGGTNYTDQSGDAGIVITKATATVNVTGYTGVYDAAAHGASGTATGVGGADLSASLGLGASFTNVPGGTATWTFSDPNYDGRSGDVAIVVSKASSTTIVTITDATYDGLGHGGSATTTGIGGLSASPTVHYAGRNTTTYADSTAAPTEAGDYTASASFSGDGNHSPSDGSASFAIGKAGSTVTVSFSSATNTSGTAWGATYDGAARTASAVVSGVGSGITQTTTASGCTTATNVPQTPCTATFTYAGDANHSGSSASATLTLAKATSTTTIAAGYNGAYTGTSHPVSGSTTGAGGLTATPAIAYAPGGATAPTGAGTYTATATYAGDANHTGSSASTSITISAAAGAVIFQTGLSGFTTAGIGVTTATVISSATVTTPFANAADARVTFTNDQYPNGIPGCIDLTVGAVSGTVGSASCQWTGQAPNTTGGNAYQVTAFVGNAGSWTGNSDTMTVTVAQPLNTNFITGGGYLNLTSSAGRYAGSGRTNYGFNVKYNKSGTNLQGNVNIIVRSGDTIYQFKSNALNQLTVAGGSANFSGKANLQSWNVNGPTQITSLGGNLTMQLTMQDVAEPGAGKDLLSIAIWDGSGALLFSSNWDTTANKTTQKTIGGGNLQVH